MKKYYNLLVFLALAVATPMRSQTVGIFLNDSLALNGYTLLAPNSSKTTWLLDNCGYVVNQWESDYFPGLSAYLLENGNMLRAARISSNFNAGGSGGRIELYNWEGDLLWGYNHSSDIFHHHHDIEMLPNGNILVIAWEAHDSNDAIANGRDPINTSSQGVWAEQIVELEMVGTNEANIVWSWSLWNHLVQDFDDTKPNYGVVSEHPGKMDINYGGQNPDWIHLNSIDYNEELDQIILSSRHLHEVWIIDHSTTTAEAATSSGGNSGRGGEILYRWGNPQVYQRGTPEDQTLFGQHNAEWIPQGYPDEGNIMVFNNGQFRPEGNYSTIDVWAPPLNNEGTYDLNPDEAFGPSVLTWQFIDTPNTLLFSQNISGAHRLPNGNTLICEGRTGHIFEVDYEGNYVWDYVSPVVNSGIVTQGNPVNNNNVFRAYKYPADYPAFDGIDLVAGDPIELEPVDYGCEIFADPTSNTIQFLPLNGIRIGSNPFDNELTIFNNTDESVLYQLVDLTGKIILFDYSNASQATVNASQLKSGMYILQVTNLERTKFFNTKVIKK